MKHTQSIQPGEGADYVTQDIAIGMLGGVEDHRREFMGFLGDGEGRRGWRSRGLA
jgi:hypothetical protein